MSNKVEDRMQISAQQFIDNFNAKFSRSFPPPRRLMTQIESEKIAAPVILPNIPRTPITPTKIENIEYFPKNYVFKRRNAVTNEEVEKIRAMVRSGRFSPGGKVPQEKISQGADKNDPLKGRRRDKSNPPKVGASKKAKVKTIAKPLLKQVSQKVVKVEKVGKSAVVPKVAKRSSEHKRKNSKLNIPYKLELYDSDSDPHIKKNIESSSSKKEISPKRTSKTMHVAASSNEKMPKKPGKKKITPKPSVKSNEHSQLHDKSVADEKAKARKIINKIVNKKKGSKEGKHSFEENSIPSIISNYVGPYNRGELESTSIMDAVLEAQSSYRPVDFKGEKPKVKPKEKPKEKPMDRKKERLKFKASRKLTT